MLWPFPVFRTRLFLTQKPRNRRVFRGHFRANLAVRFTLLLVCLAPAWAAHAQQQLPDASQGLPPIRGTSTSPGADPSRPDAGVQEHLQILRNDARQKQLVADTQKLLVLAQQLRDEVAKSKKDELSVSVMKTSDQIEKLAKHVKEEMRGY
jgi:hypothetical protein